MNKFLTRTLTGAVFVALMVFSILWSQTLLVNVFLVFTCIGLYEYRTILWENGIRLSVLFYVVALLVYFLLSFEVKGIPFQLVLPLSFCFALLLLVAALFQKEEAVAFRDVAYSLTGILWIAVPFALLNFFPLIGRNAVGGPHQPAVGQWILLACFVTVWANDTFAYCVGSLIGRHKFFERISPKKTWEGTLGGAVLTLVLACLYTRLFAQVPLNAAQWMGLALIVVVMGSLGDLVESFFKRRMNVKDSGNILPGHGGILDRFDSALMSLPFVLLYLQLVL